MNKALFFAAAVICAAALAVSCQEKEVEVNVTPNVRMVTMTCELPATDTKVAINIDGNAGKVTWTAGDKIHIHTGHIKDGEYTTVTLTAEDISADGKSAKISFPALTPYNFAGWGDWAANYSTYYAAYPADAIDLSTTSPYQKQYFANSNSILMAASDMDGVFKFYNLCGLIAFTLSDSYDSYEFSGNNGEIVGYSKYVAEINEPVDEHDYKDSAITGPLDAITGNIVSGVNYICLPNGADFEGGFSIKLKKDGQFVKIATTQTAVTVSRNNILDLGDITTKLQSYSHQNQITDAINLGASETANCYIIDKAGAYKIPAVKGNSNESAGTVAGVKLVWETYNNAEDVEAKSVIAAVDYDDSAVYFKTPDQLKPGNALIAALDAQDNIIWSWHIWIPATAIQEVGSYNVAAKYLLDRNIGALTAAVAGNSPIDITSIGLFYQWGRKDPFVGPREINEGQYPSKAKVAGEERTAEKVQISLAESIAKPTFFARGHYTGDTLDNPDWCSDQNPEYWGDSGDKSIYDPCPAGYRVPKRDKTKLLWADSMSDYEYSADNYWFKVGDPAVVFPAVGWIDGGSIKTTCRFGLWNAHNDSYLNPDTGSSNYAAYARRFYLESSVKLKNSSVNKSLGYSVRCESISNTVPKPQEPDKVGATSVILDGNFDDWANADAISNSGAIKEWKFGYDANNIYFYFKIVRSDIIAGKDDAYVDGLGYSFAWRRYIYIGLDTDNNTATGAAVTSGNLSIEGCEVKALVYPFRGYSQSASGTDGSTVVNGEDENSYIQCPVGTAVENAHITAYGAIDEDFGYLEIGIPRDKIGSPAASKMNVQFSLSSNLTGAQVINIQL